MKPFEEQKFHNIRKFASKKRPPDQAESLKPFDTKGYKKDDTLYQCVVCFWRRTWDTHICESLPRLRFKHFNHWSSHYHPTIDHFFVSHYMA